MGDGQITMELSMAQPGNEYEIKSNLGRNEYETAERFGLYVGRRVYLVSSFFDMLLYRWTDIILLSVMM